MKLMLLLKVPFLGTTIALCSLFQAQAQLEVRLSVKVILDANGLRPAGGTLSTDGGIRSSVTDANSLLASFGRGYQYRITEILDLPGHSELLDLGCQDASDAIEAGVQNNPVSYTWRNNAVNVYVNKGDDNASCAFNSLLVLKYTSGSGAFLHEGGHHLCLCHTQGCGCKDCTECPGIVDDTIADTLPDRECWDQDDISTNSFHKLFVNLSPAQQAMVSNTFNNIMSYHKASQGSTKDVFTPDQWDRIADFTRTDRVNVMNGKTLFVDRTNTSCSFPLGFSQCSGGLRGPYPTVTLGVNAANGGDIVLIRRGHYNEPMTINKPITLRATRGDALVGVP
jgi:Pregnancy-associated plasma protein-A